MTSARRRRWIGKPCNSKLADGTEVTPELGAVKGFFITRAADERIRRRAQHGGTVTALIVLALREGLIDAAVLAGEGEGLLPRGVTVRDPEAAAAMGKSRFVVSPTVAEFNRAVRTDCQRIGVVATPCQALALAKMRTQPVTDYRQAVSRNCGLSSGSSAVGPSPGGNSPPSWRGKRILPG